MTAVKIKRRHIRYLVLASVMGFVQIYRTLDNEAIPAVAEDHSAGTYVIDKNSGMISKNSDIPEEESIGSDEVYISSNSSGSPSTFSQGAFSKTNSTESNQPDYHISNNIGVNSQSNGSNSITFETAIVNVPIEEDRTPAIAGTFTKQYYSGGKFAAAGMPSGGEEVLDVPPPPPTPTEVPLDPLSLVIVLIGLGIGSWTIIGAKGSERNSKAI